LKPPFTYWGGKQRLVPKILPLIPDHRIYVEPFCGGATLLFAKGKKVVSSTRFYKEVINDTNCHITNFFSVLRDPVKAPRLLEVLALTPYSKGEHTLCKSKNFHTDDDVEWARQFFFNISTSFFGKMDNSFQYSKHSENAGNNFKNQIQRLTPYTERLRDVLVLNKDALAVIKEWDSPFTVFYCDPPYPNTDGGHYDGYTQTDFENLLDTLSTIQGSFLLSGYPNDAVPKHWEKFEFHVSSAAAQANNKKDFSRTEVVWRRLSPKISEPDYNVYLNSELNSKGEIYMRKNRTPQPPSLF